MYSSTVSKALVLSLLCSVGAAFSPAGTATRRVVAFQQSAKDDDFASLVPETSFGAEVVPEGQRPVNEYLDLVRAPLFGWASEDVGTKGLLTRLVTSYCVIFATVYVYTMYHSIGYTH